jgi:predicted nuclease with TOPRIM domain
MVELGEVVKCYILDVTESEKQTLDTLRALNGGTYELVSEVLVNAQENLDKNSEFSAKIDELNETIATLNTENSGICERYDEAQQAIASLQEENESLNTYKLNIETQQKNAVIDEYGEHLDEEILNKYREHIADYTCEELDMHLAYELKKNNSSIFNKDENSGFVPKDVPADGITAILSKYKK